MTQGRGHPIVPQSGPRGPESPPSAVEPRLGPPPGRSPAAPASPPPPAAATPAEAARRTGLTPVSLFLTLLVAYVAIEVQLVLILLLMALVLATAIERPVQLLERRRLPRPIGILAVYAAIIGSVVLLFVLAAPVIGDQAVTLNQELPERLENLQQQWATSGNPVLNGPARDLIRQTIAVIRQPEQIPVPELPTGGAIDVVLGVVGGVVGLVTVFVIAFYYLMEKRWLRRLVLDEVASEHQARLSRVWDNVEAKVGDWLRGQLLLCLVIGLLATVGYGVLGVPFWPLLGLWAGLTEIVPVVGPWLGGVPAVIIALTQSWNTAFLVIGFIFILQMLENTILVPRIMRGAVGLTPLTVFVAILAGTQFRGIVGAILAIPVAAAVQVFLTDFLAARRSAQSDNGSPTLAWRWMRGPVLANATPPPPSPPAPPAAHAAPMTTPAIPPPTPAPTDPSPAESKAPPVTPSPTSQVGRWADALNRAVKRPDAD